VARADLLCDMIKYGLNSDIANFRKVAEAICAEERAKQHSVLANRIDEMLRVSNRVPSFIPKNGNGEANLVVEKIPERRIGDLLLPKPVYDSCQELVEEYMRTDLLRSYGLEPRNRILLIGPPGNGKTSKVSFGAIMV